MSRYEDESIRVETKKRVHGARSSNRGPDYGGFWNPALSTSSGTVKNKEKEKKIIEKLFRVVKNGTAYNARERNRLPDPSVPVFG